MAVVVVYDGASIRMTPWQKLLIYHVFPITESAGETKNIREDDEYFCLTALSDRD